MKNKIDFMEAVRKGPLLFDGAMGTVLYDRGIFINRCFEESNLSQSGLIKEIHDDYIDAGAQVIETNSFGANRIKLGNHGIGEKTVEINLASARIAAEAAGDTVYVAGAVGPTGLTPGVTTNPEMTGTKEVFLEQITALVEGGIDVILLETFRNLKEFSIALEAAREVCNLPVIGQLTFESDGFLADGTAPRWAFSSLKAMGVDIIGANCAEGPQKIFDIVEQFVGHGVPISAQPNAGLPRRIGERLIYMANPEYLGEYAKRMLTIGVRLIGGCCGTTPIHTRRMAAAVRMAGGGRIQVVSLEQHPEDTEKKGLTPATIQEKSPFAQKVLNQSEFAVSVEVNAPVGLDLTRSIKAAKMLKTAGVDVINIADGPRASARMFNMASAVRIRQETGIDVLLHVCTRDRNFIALQSDLLGAHALDLHNLVVITGDPPKLGNFPESTAVFDLDSIGLLRMADNLNHGLDPVGRVLRSTTSFFLLCGAEPGSMNYDREIRRLEKKKEAGAEAIMTQPVYDGKLLERFLDDIDHLNLPVLVGLLPLVSHRNAEFLHNEVPGMQIPDSIREKMRAVGKGPKAQALGISIAQEALLAAKNRVAGAYIMPPLGKYHLAIKVLSVMGYSLPENS